MEPVITAVGDTEEEKMAFVAGSTFVGAKVGPATRPSVSKKAVVAKRTTTSMGVKDSKDTFAPGEKPEFKFGFYKFNERLNGRFAMMGLVIGLATEILNPNHPTIVKQVMTLFGQ
mmetsp:Transcript_12940/g.39828  ORF Transcript_12940/g.39828 Transcript_12940/m.39828 type:complete len:115 (+) Transcript_12940:84-428(+)|eukprot:CAMPEP_0198723024 /NCGR_PEP_ID=MMETSP1475-20131203/586_1 /TAXON_ID= ORGANISM="Unidentified sp., Strain CCMP1999" /NCGR_SAMPLE_ID=MMETSP1475 /ASSEMBLY_ACC=CAM_ASM_001111 /LENGTH=114 /DNA_ID=CAMNT_0044484003 /DNA_START=53 /DNA_END=397 /DNA_ORIENTATION=+